MDQIFNALEVMEEVLAVDPEHFLAISNVAESAFQCGDYNKAMEKDLQWLQMIGGQEIGEHAVKEIEKE